MLFAGRYKSSITDSQTTSHDPVRNPQSDASKLQASQGYLFYRPTRTSSPTPATSSSTPATSSPSSATSSPSLASSSPKVSLTPLRPSMSLYTGTFHLLERRHALRGPAQPLARDAFLVSAWTPSHLSKR